jgi:alkanesulfonate monooxygenase SsuD/methylene tetrahydromethanopterin reductase-like flavin-dependent oxidoreductase (luciferase family)
MTAEAATRIVDFGVALDFGGLDVGGEGQSFESRLGDLRYLAQVAEDAGFGSVWIGENYLSKPGSWHPSSSLALIAALSTATGLRLGSGVALLPAWTPLRLAYDSAMVDQITGGRLSLGVGLGGKHIRGKFGVEPNSVATWMDEMLLALRAMWRGDDHFVGNEVEAVGPIWPTPFQPGGPPLLVGGRVAASATRAARLGDGYYGATPYSLTADFVPIAEQYRRDGGDGEFIANRLCVVSSQREVALVESERGVRGVLNRYAAIGEVKHLDGSRCRPEDLDLRETHREIALIGTPDQINADVEAYVEQAGVTGLQLRVFSAGTSVAVAESTIRLVGAEVIPNWT